MSKHHMTLIEYGSLELHPISDEKHNWLLSTKEVCSAFGIDMLTLLDLIDTHKKTLTEDKHYLYDSLTCCQEESSQILLWTKKGIMRVAYYIKSDEALAFLDFIEDLYLQPDSEFDTKISKFYDEIENTLSEKLSEIKNDKDYKIEDLNKLIFTIDNLSKKRQQIGEQPHSEESPISDVMSSVFKLLNLDEDTLKSGVNKFVEKGLEQKAKREQQNSEEDTSKRVPI